MDAVGTKRRWLTGAALSLAVSLVSCAAPPPPPPPTVVSLTLSTGPDANPNAAGQGAPVIVRVYQLGSSAGFEKAEFYRLFNQDAATLGADVIKRDEYLLAPGTTKTVQLDPPAPVKAIGVFAAYRDFSHVTWRGVAAVPEHKTTTVTVTAAAAGIEVAAKTAEPAPAKPAS